MLVQNGVSYNAHVQR